jgi:hypothetical protein
MATKAHADAASFLALPLCTDLDIRWEEGVEEHEVRLQ